MKIKFFSILFGIIMLIPSCENRGKSSAKKDVNPIEKINEMAGKLSSQFDLAEEYHEGLISYQDNGKYGFKDAEGNVVIKAKYDQVGCFNEGLVSVTINGKMGYINHYGEIVVPPQYDITNFYSNGLAVVCKNGRWGYIDKTGSIAIELTYDKAGDFWDPNGFASVRRNGKEGLIDIHGNIVVPIEFEHTYSTQNGVAYVLDGYTEMAVYNDKSYKITEY